MTTLSASVEIGVHVLSLACVDVSLGFYHLRITCALESNSSARARDTFDSPALPFALIPPATKRLGAKPAFDARIDGSSFISSTWPLRFIDDAFSLEEMGLFRLEVPLSATTTVSARESEDERREMEGPPVLIRVELMRAPHTALHERVDGVDPTVEQVFARFEPVAVKTLRFLRPLHGSSEYYPFHGDERAFVHAPLCVHSVLCGIRASGRGRSSDPAALGPSSTSSPLCRALGDSDGALGPEARAELLLLIALLASTRERLANKLSRLLQITGAPAERRASDTAADTALSADKSPQTAAAATTLPKSPSAPIGAQQAASSPWSWRSVLWPQTAQEAEAEAEGRVRRRDLTAPPVSPLPSGALAQRQWQHLMDAEEAELTALARAPLVLPPRLRSHLLSSHEREVTLGPVASVKAGDTLGLFAWPSAAGWAGGSVASGSATGAEAAEAEAVEAESRIGAEFGLSCGQSAWLLARMRATQPVHTRYVLSEQAEAGVSGADAIVELHQLAAQVFPLWRGLLALLRRRVRQVGVLLRRRWLVRQADRWGELVFSQCVPPRTAAQTPAHPAVRSISAATAAMAGWVGGRAAHEPSPLELAAKLRRSAHFDRLRPLRLADAEGDGAAMQQQPVLVLQLHPPAAAAAGGRAARAQLPPPPAPPRNSPRSRQLAWARPPAQPPSQPTVHLIVLVHGWGGSSLDLRTLRNHMRTLLPEPEQETTGADGAGAWLLPRRLYLLSAANEQQQQQLKVGQMGANLCAEVLACLAAHSLPVGSHAERTRLGRVSFVGFSLGGLIIRAALTHAAMEPLLPKLHTLLTLATPNLGVRLGPSLLVGAGARLLNSLTPSPCLTELLLADAPEPAQCALARMAGEKVLGNFRNVLLLTSAQDTFIPRHSARVELPTDAAAASDRRLSSVVAAMVSSLSEQLAQVNTVRLEIVWPLAAGPVTLSKVIGHAAHLGFLESTLFYRLFLQTLGRHYLS